MTFNFKLRDYQLKGVKYALKYHYSINADMMGLGKTIQALGLVHYSQAEKVVIICPAFLQSNWKKEIETAFGGFNEWRFLVTSYTKAKSIDPYWREDIDLVICDEVHYLKTPTSQRTKAVYNYIKSTKPKRFLGLTGTPIKNRVQELFMLIKLCTLNPLKTYGKPFNMDYWDFSYRYANAKKQSIGGREFTKFEGIRNVDQLKELLTGKYIRRNVDAVDLPDLIKQNIDLSLPKTEAQKVIHESLLQYGSGNSSHFMVQKAVMALSKAKTTAKYVSDMVEQGEKVIVFSDHVAATEEIAKGIKGEVEVVTGKTPMDARHEIVEDFQKGEIDVVVATVGALGVGVTLTSARHVVFNDYPFVPADLEQAEKRIHRIGQNRTCFVSYIFSNSMDHRIFNIIHGKDKVIKQVI